MNRPVVLILVLVAACSEAPQAPKSPAGRGGPPPPFLLYQTRTETPSGDRLAAGRDGAALFSNNCGYCHLSGGMGKGAMPHQTKVDVTDAELDSIADYLGRTKK